MWKLCSFKVAKIDTTNTERINSQYIQLSILESFFQTEIFAGEAIVQVVRPVFQQAMVNVIHATIIQQQLLQLLYRVLRTVE